MVWRLPRGRLHHDAASNLSRSEIQTRVAKTDEWVWMPAHPDLRVILDRYLEQRDAERAVVPVGYGVENEPIVLNRRGMPFTENGFQGSFFKVIRQLEREGKVDDGLTFHGLRKSCGTNLAEAGCSAHMIMSILGLKTLAMAQRYTEQAERKQMARAAMAIITAKPNGALRGSEGNGG